MVEGVLPQYVLRDLVSTTGDLAALPTTVVRLLDLLNQGPFVLAAPGANAHDGYGRELRHVLRGRADGSVQSIADDMVASGAARAYQRGARLPWC